MLTVQSCLCGTHMTFNSNEMAVDNMTVLEGEATALFDAIYFADENKWNWVVFESDLATRV